MSSQAQKHIVYTYFWYFFLAFSLCLQLHPSNATTSSTVPKYFLLEQCLKWECDSNFKMETVSPFPTQDSYNFNICQQNTPECFVNSMTFESNEKDKVKIQHCYNTCYNQYDYTANLFKSFLQCSWQCAESTFGISNNFYIQTWNVINYSSMAFLITLLLLIGIKYLK